MGPSNSSLILHLINGNIVRESSKLFIEIKANKVKSWRICWGMWRRDVVVITTAQLHSTKAELRFCAGSNLVPGVSEIRDGENLWQRSWLEIRLNAFHWLTTLPKQFIIHHHIEEIHSLENSLAKSTMTFSTWKKVNVIVKKRKKRLLKKHQNYYNEVPTTDFSQLFVAVCEV